MTDEKSIHFDNSINKFLNHIESLWTSLPVVLKTIESTQRNADQERNNFLIKNCPLTEDKKFHTIPLEHNRRNNELKKAVDNSTTAIKIIKRNFLVSLTSQFDTYVGDLIKTIFEVKPEIIQNSEKQLTFSELNKFENIKDAQDYIIEKRD